MGRRIGERSRAESVRPAVRLVPATVWAHQGLWCKVLDRDPSHREVLASVPGIGPERARGAAVGLGLAEVGLAALVATAGHRRSVAAIQTALVVAFNAGGLAVGRAHIPNPVRLLVRNGLVLAAMWIPVDGRAR